MGSERQALVGRDLDLARSAYGSLNLEASRMAHQHLANTDEPHKESGNVIKSLVFGGLDGVLTTFAIVSGASGGGLSSATILILGLSNKIADALSMGLGDALSSKAENEAAISARERVSRDFDEDPDREIAELVKIYVSQGVVKRDAEELAMLFASNRDVFADVMLQEGYETMLPDMEENPWKEGFVTFTSFIVFGFAPLLAYCVFPFVAPDVSQQILFIVACSLSGLSLFALGAVKAKFSKKSWMRSGMEMLVLGSAVAALAYSLGAAANTVLAQRGIVPVSVG